MSLMPYITTATELQRNYKKVAKKAKEIRDVVVVLSNNHPEGVYMDYNTFVDKYVSGEISERQNKKSGLLSLVGSMTEKEVLELNKSIDEMCENIDPEMWK